jgi:hypothetical protein
MRKLMAIYYHKNIRDIVSFFGWQKMDLPALGKRCFS